MYTYFEFIAEFSRYPKTNDLPLDFINFMSENHPEIFENICMFMSDMEVDLDVDPRFALRGFDSLFKGEPNRVLDAAFYVMLQRNWEELTDQKTGNCCVCGEESDDVQVEHEPIVAYEFGPIIKFHEYRSMDGAISVERPTCRKCAIKLMQFTLSKADPEKQTCYAFPTIFKE